MHHAALGRHAEGLSGFGNHKNAICGSKPNHGVPDTTRREGSRRERAGMPRDCADQRRLASKKSSTNSGTLPNSMYRRRNSSEMSTVTSRDQPSAVLKATMRTG